MLIMFFPCERLSQRVYYIEICVYFANLYISFLDMFADGAELALDMLGILARHWFLSIGYDTIVVAIDDHRIQRT